jgi:deoxyhypusine synthase
LKKDDFLKETVKHIDITEIDSRNIINGMSKMSFSAGSAARAADIYNRMIKDSDCSVILTLAGSTSAAGCMHIYADMIKYKMVDAVVATGASIVDMDFFEALGYRHYKGSPYADNRELRSLYIDRIYDTYIDEEELQNCDAAICKIADSIKPGIYSSREFIHEMGRYLYENNVKTKSLVLEAYKNKVPVFCPAFSDSSAGFGLVMHQENKKENYVSIDSVKDFRELTEIKIKAGKTGLFMVGGGVPKNFAQDTVICAELLGKEVPMHEYAVQITVADERDGGCSGSTLKEACSWGKVDITDEQMVYSEATVVLPLIVSYVYSEKNWQNRKPRCFSDLFKAG